LTVVYGFSETLADASRRSADDVPGIAAIVSAEALEASRTVEDLVAAKEIEEGDLEMRTVGFDPAEEVERAVTPFRRLGSDISVEAWSGTAVSDPLRFRKVIQNLLSNAVRHGGAEIAVHADLSGSSYECTIADDGDGLPAEVARRIFATTAAPDGATSEETASDESGHIDSEGPDGAEELEVESGSDRTGDQVDGLGLGLVVAVGLAESLGGSLRYERADGLTAFTLVLPTTSWPQPLVPMHTESISVEGMDEASDSDEEADEGIGHGAMEAKEEETIRFDAVPTEHDLENPSSAESTGESADDEVLVDGPGTEVRAS
jgi:hypothetical protein